jgi:predicted MPP superfamily phosphohydrolase
MYLSNQNTLGQQLLNWQNPVNRIKDPLHQRWAEIVQIMDTHINGVCPLHIYINRRPLESQNPYAIEYRVNNFQPLTKDPFDKFINGVIDVCRNANIQVNISESILNLNSTINQLPILDFCNSDLVRIRENDPNAVIVVMPLIEKVETDYVSIVGVDIVVVMTKDIIKKGDNYIEFYYDTVDENKLIVEINNGQYILKVKDKKGKESTFPIVSLLPKKPYIDISDNIVYEGKYKLRIPYSFGASAWGDKFYGQESDFSIQATRYTYLKEIRAKERCDEVGVMFQNGKHCYTNGDLCQRCGGSGFVKDDSPLGTIYVDYSKLNSEERAFPQVIQWAEPPQTALTSSKDITNEYFDRMTEALGLLKQNYTNQSGVSKEFDWKEKLSTISKIFNDNIRVAKEIYRHIEYLIIDEEVQTSTITLVGELGYSDLDSLLEKLTEAKKNMSPSSIITGLIDQIYRKTLPSEYADFIIKVAKKYNKLYIYGLDEVTMAKAQLGNSVTEKDIVVNNTLVDVILDYLKVNGLESEDNVVKYLDEYYARFTPPQQTSTSLGLL